MSKNAAFTKTRAASETIELVPMANIMPALTAFYSSIDVLKHCRLEMLRKKQPLAQFQAYCGLTRFHKTGNKKTPSKMEQNFLRNSYPHVRFLRRKNAYKTLPSKIKRCRTKEFLARSIGIASKSDGISYPNTK